MCNIKEAIVVGGIYALGIVSLFILANLVLN